MKLKEVKRNDNNDIKWNILSVQVIRSERQEYQASCATQRRSTEDAETY